MVSMYIWYSFIYLFIYLVIYLFITGFINFRLEETIKAEHKYYNQNNFQNKYITINKALFSLEQNISDDLFCSIGLILLYFKTSAIAGFGVLVYLSFR